jgi:hypothetical protein
MAVTLSTTLASAALASDRTIKLTSGTGAAVGMVVKMETEWSSVSAIAADGVTITLGLRGDKGSAALPHKALSAVQVGNAVDFTITSPIGSPTPIPLTTPGVVYYGVAGAIAIPAQDSNIFLNGAAAIAMTLAIPGTDIDGRRLTIAAATAFAHTVTTPALGFKGTVQIGTFGGAVGDGMTIIAQGGRWLPAAAINITFS